MISQPEQSNPARRTTAAVAATGYFEIDDPCAYECASGPWEILAEPIEIVQNPERVRKVERPSLLAGIDKIRTATGWEPETSLHDTLAELIKR